MTIDPAAIARSIHGYVAGKEDHERVLPAIQFVANREHEIADVVAESVDPANALMRTLRGVLDDFVSHYPCGINPFLDEAWNKARAAIASMDAVDAEPARVLDAALRAVVTRHVVVGSYPDTMGIAREAYALGARSTLAAGRRPSDVIVDTAPLAVDPAKAASDRDERAHEERVRLDEIADGAYGDGPRTRGAARRALEAMDAAERQAAEQEVVATSITRGDLERLDAVVSLLEGMASLFSPDMYDEIWNMRNRIAPYLPGERHHSVPDA